MNIYEAYQEVKKDKIISVTIGDNIYFILQTTETPMGTKRIIQISLEDSCLLKVKMPKELADIEYKELEQICLGAFNELTRFEIVTKEHILLCCQNEWKNNNK